ncbi:hypothetical protein C7M84_013565, partial [Penaeus vannamei]
PTGRSDFIRNKIKVDVERRTPSQHHHGNSCTERHSQTARALEPKFHYKTIFHVFYAATYAARLDPLSNLSLLPTSYRALYWLLSEARFNRPGRSRHNDTMRAASSQNVLSNRTVDRPFCLMSPPLSLTTPTVHSPLVPFCPPVCLAVPNRPLISSSSLIFPSLFLTSSRPSPRPSSCSLTSSLRPFFLSGLLCNLAFKPSYELIEGSPNTPRYPPISPPARSCILPLLSFTLCAAPSPRCPYLSLLVALTPHTPSLISFESRPLAPLLSFSVSFLPSSSPLRTSPSPSPLRPASLLPSLSPLPSFPHFPLLHRASFRKPFSFRTIFCFRVVFSFQALLSSRVSLHTSPSLLSLALLLLPSPFISFLPTFSSPRFLLAPALPSSPRPPPTPLFYTLTALLALLTPESLS